MTPPYTYVLTSHFVRRQRPVSSPLSPPLDITACSSHLTVSPACYLPGSADTERATVRPRHVAHAHTSTQTHRPHSVHHLLCPSLCVSSYPRRPHHHHPQILLLATDPPGLHSLSLSLFVSLYPLSLSPSFRAWLPALPNLISRLVLTGTRFTLHGASAKAQVDRGHIDAARSSLHC